MALLAKRITSSDAAGLVSLFHDLGKVIPFFVLILNGKDYTRQLVQDRYNPIHANYEEDITGEDPYIDPPARDSAVFENLCMVLRDVIGQYQDAATPLKTFESGKLHYGNGNPSASAYDSRADFI